MLDDERDSLLFLSISRNLPERDARINLCACTSKICSLELVALELVDKLDAHTHGDSLKEQHDEDDDEDDEDEVDSLRSFIELAFNVDEQGLEDDFSFCVFNFDFTR